MAEAIGVVSAVIGSADVCVRAGRSLYQRYRNYKDAEQDIKDLAWLLKNHWLKIESKVALIKDLNDVLEESLHQHFQELFEILNRKLLDAERKIQAVDRKQGRLKRVKFAALVKESLEAAIAEIEKWQSQLELPYFLLARINNPRVDETLTIQRTRSNDSADAIKRLRMTIKTTETSNGGAERSIFLPASELGNDSRIIDPYTSLKLTKITSQGGRDFLVDTISMKQLVDDGQRAIGGIRDVARILAQADPLTFGILTCHGVVKESRDNGLEMIFQIIFSIPNQLHEPRSLRNFLAMAKNERRAKYPLNERFALAKKLSRSIMFVHASNLVHKNIRPETIVLFQDSKSLLGTPFLVGFQKIRAVDAATLLVGDAEWEKDIYRHPTRQGLKPEDAYRMQHDIYSLGVCLLEIGLWTSFVQWDGDRKIFEPGPDLMISQFLGLKDQRKKANGIKNVLLGMAKELLPGTMGPKYADVVISCLTCLDKGNDKFGNEEDLYDEDGIVVGVRYVEIVAMKLEEIDV